MTQTAFFINKNEYEKLLELAFKKLQSNNIFWCDEIIRMIKKIVSNETTEDILFNHDGKGNICIACFFNNRIRLHQCKQGSGSIKDYNSQLHVFDFLIPTSVEYLDSVEVGSFIITSIKIRGMDSPFKLFVRNNEEIISPIVDKIYVPYKS